MSDGSGRQHPAAESHSHLASCARTRTAARCAKHLNQVLLVRAYNSCPLAISRMLEATANADNAVVLQSRRVAAETGVSADTTYGGRVNIAAVIYVVGNNATEFTHTHTHRNTPRWQNITARWRGAGLSKCIFFSFRALTLWRVRGLMKV